MAKQLAGGVVEGRGRHVVFAPSAPRRVRVHVHRLGPDRGRVRVDSSASLFSRWATDVSAVGVAGPRDPVVIEIEGADCRARWTVYAASPDAAVAAAAAAE